MFGKLETGEVSHALSLIVRGQVDATDEHAETLAVACIRELCERAEMLPTRDRAIQAIATYLNRHNSGFAFSSLSYCHDMGELILTAELNAERSPIVTACYTQPREQPRTRTRFIPHNGGFARLTYPVK